MCEGKRRIDFVDYGEWADWALFAMDRFDARISLDDAGGQFQFNNVVWRFNAPVDDHVKSLHAAGMI